MVDRFIAVPDTGRLTLHISEQHDSARGRSCAGHQASRHIHIGTRRPSITSGDDTHSVANIAVSSGPGSRRASMSFFGMGRRNAGNRSSFTGSHRAPSTVLKAPAIPGVCFVLSVCCGCCVYVIVCV